MPSRPDAHALSLSLEPEERMRAARLATCPPDDLVRLTRDAWEVSKTAWSNRRLPRRTVLQGIQMVATGQSHAAKVGLLLNTALTGEDLVSMNVPEAAAHRNYPVEMMMDIALYSTRKEQTYLARNRNLYQDVEDALCYSPSTAVRRVFAKNRHISGDSVRILSEDTSPAVLRGVIGHPLAAPYRESILQRLKDIADSSDGNAAHTLNCIARYTDDPVFLAEAAQHENPLVYETALKNQAAAEETLRDACFSSNRRRRTAASHNVSCPEEYQVAAALLN